VKIPIDSMANNETKTDKVQITNTNENPLSDGFPIPMPCSRALEPNIYT